MIKPVSYLQTDLRWKDIDYSAAGESTTIGKSGCGPSCMAMVIASLKDKKVTPKETSAWALKKGYKAKNQGTYYTYFTPQGKEYGIEVERVNTSNIYGDMSSSAHNKALNAIKNGDWVICCMGKGSWTSSGHFILWYGLDGLNALINDPNNTKPERLKASVNLLQSQVKYYFIVKVPTIGDHTEEATELANEIASVITISDKPTLIKELNSYYNGSMYWVIKKLLSSDLNNKTAINGRTDIYRRTLKAITIKDKVAYNIELLSAGKNSLFWVIKKLLDKLGVS